MVNVKHVAPMIVLPVAELFGLKVIPNAGGGDCGVYVIHRHVTRIDGYKDLSVLDVRLRIAQELSKDALFFSGFIPNCQFDCQCHWQS